MNTNTVTIPGVRFSYCSLFQARPPKNDPTGDPKYSTTILLPKSNSAAKALLDQAVAQAIESGVTTKWNGVRPPMIPVPVHDGDGPRPSDGMPFGEECRGCWVFTASSRQAPFVVDTQVQAIIDPTAVYSGMYGNVNVTFFPYNNGGKKGIGCGLNGVQKVSDGEPLSGRVTAEEAFQPMDPAGPPSPYGAAPAAYDAASGYGTAPAAYDAASGYGTAPAAYNTVPGYGAAPAPGYGTPPAYAPPAPVGYGTGPAAPPSAYPAPGGPAVVDPATGEVMGRYPLNGVPGNGI